MAEKVKIKIKEKGFENVIFTRFDKWGIYLGAKDGKLYQMPMLQQTKKPYVKELGVLERGCDHLLSDIFNGGGFANEKIEKCGCEDIGCENRKGREGTFNEEFAE